MKESKPLEEIILLYLEGQLKTKNKVDIEEAKEQALRGVLSFAKKHGQETERSMKGVC